ncbi:MAG: helix-turn-helix transcriptional regulator [Clostridia bacterium]|nr:helix-turn-helix transcriptional regulator [Clostridia bacterium]
MSDTHAIPLIPVAGYRCSYGYHKSYVSSGTHIHDAYEICIHIRGSGRFRIGADVLPIQSMSAYVIAPGQPHGLEASEPLQNLEFLVLNVTEKLLAELSFRDCRLQSGLEEILSHPHQQLPITQELWRNISPLVAGIKADLPTLSPAEQQISLGCLSVILGMFCFVSRRTNVAYITNTNTASTIRRVEMHISQYFTEDCSLRRLSEIFGISPYHLSRQFAQVCGVTLHEYLIMNRIAYARRLLQQGEAPANVAAACGFNDYSSFLRAFTRLTGQTPSQWKKTHPAASVYTG